MDIKAKVLRNLSYGLYLIGVMDGERPCGCIVNTVFQVTSENPIVAISMNKNNYTWELLEREGRFAVSILSEKTRKEVIQKLGFVSGRDHDKYEGIDYDARRPAGIKRAVLRRADLQGGFCHRDPDPHGGAGLGGGGV